SVDPGLLLYMVTRLGIAAEELDRALNEQSGMLGVSGISADVREVLAAAGAGNARAQLARAMFVHRLVECVGGLVAVLNGLGALVFTGGIGEHSAEIRELSCQAFAYLGLQLNHAANDLGAPDSDISAASAPVRVLVIAAR